MENLKFLSEEELISYNGGSAGPVDGPMKHKWYTVQGWIEFNYRLGYVAGKVYSKVCEAF